MATSKIVLITGGNAGIGYEIVKALLQSSRGPYHVIMGSRSLQKAAVAIENLKKEVSETPSTIEALQVDLSSDESIEKAFEALKSGVGHIDTLVNNAGASFDPSFTSGKISLRECFNGAYDTNVAGTHVLTYTLIPLLLKSSDPRLIFVTGLSSMTTAAVKYFPTPDLPAGWPKVVPGFETIGYRCSKTALNMLILDWAHKLKADGVKVFGAGPGMNLTDLGGIRDIAENMAEKLGINPPSYGGGFIASVVEGDRDEDAGKLVQRNGITPF